MTGPRKVRANRKNALQSTGPRTQAGKARASKNALTHGLLSQDVLLPDEDGKALEALQIGLHTDLEPKGELETMLVDRIVGLTWRWLRLNRIETGLFLTHLHTKQENEEDAFVQLNRRTLPSWAEDKGLSLTDMDHRAGTYGKTFSGLLSDRLLLLARYETGTDRAFYRALHELQRLQAARGKPSPKPLAVDVNVDVDRPGGNGEL